MALKDWKKIGFASEGDAYEKGKTVIYVDTNFSPVKDHKWILIKRTYSPTSGTNESIIFHSDNKTKVNQKAMAYMRSH